MIHRVEPDGQRDLEKLLRALPCPGLICCFSSSQRRKGCTEGVGWEVLLSAPLTVPDELDMSFRQKES